MNKIFKMVVFSDFLMLFVSNFCIPSEAKEPEDAEISETAYKACEEIGEEYGICPELLMAIIEKESGGQPDAENGDCKGLMQISAKWHKDRMKRLGVTDLFDERSNILVGADYLSDLFESYEDPALVLMVCHGERNAVSNAESGHISDYAREILRRSLELERSRGK